MKPPQPASRTPDARTIADAYTSCSGASCTPLNVATQVQTTGSLGFGGSLAATLYAYGNAQPIFDSWLDAFTLPAYGRTVTLRMGTSGGETSTATLVDTYPLAPYTASPPEERVGRYLDRRSFAS